MDQNFINGFEKTANLFKSMGQAINAVSKTTLKSGKTWKEGIDKARTMPKTTPDMKSYVAGLSQKKSLVNPPTDPNLSLHAQQRLSTVVHPPSYRAEGVGTNFIPKDPYKSVTGTPKTKLPGQPTRKPLFED